ncbi:MAG: hypothetical protein GWP74_00875 [Proteobacteria bacterium]|nr:hypothetical protein [Pseudomonadota bacterium]
MTIATSLKAFLEKNTADFETVAHPHTQSSIDTSIVAHVPPARLAKAVIIKDDEAYLMLVVPADHHVHLGRLHHYLGREVGLATEEELSALSPDCDLGAIPPLGAVYGVRALVASSLAEQPELFLESGDHRTLVKVSGEQFASLIGNAEWVDVNKQL